MNIVFMHVILHIINSSLIYKLYKIPQIKNVHIYIYINTHTNILHINLILSFNK